MFEMACISKLKIEHQIKCSITVDSTVIEALNQRLHNRQINGWTSIESSIVQAYACATDESTVILIILKKKRIKISRCRFSANVVLSKFPALCQIFMCKTVLIFPNIYIIHKRN